jgi:hypothetical protein
VHSGRQTRLLRTYSVDASSPRGRACVNISTHPSKSSRRCLPACPAVAQAVGHDDGGSVPLEGGNHKGSLCSHISKHTRWLWWYYSSCFVLDKTRGERRLCLVKRANLLALGPRRPPLAMGSLHLQGPKLQSKTSCICAIMYFRGAAFTITTSQLLFVAN